jgi:hypothetical protein
VLFCICNTFQNFTPLDGSAELTNCIFLKYYHKKYSTLIA